MYRILSTLSFLCLALALAVVPGAAYAQEESMNDRDVLDLFLPNDSTELQLQGSTQIALNDDTPNNGNIFVNYGWFLTERQQIGGSALISIRDDDGDIDFSGFGGPFYRYNILTGKVAPYVGASLGLSFGDFAGASDYLLELEAGSRWFLRRDVSFNASASMLYDIDNSELYDVLNVRFGFSYFWQ